MAINRASPGHQRRAIHEALRRAPKDSFIDARLARSSGNAAPAQRDRANARCKNCGAGRLGDWGNVKDTAKRDRAAGIKRAAQSAYERTGGAAAAIDRQPGNRKRAVRPRRLIKCVCISPRDVNELHIVGGEESGTVWIIGIEKIAAVAGEDLVYLSGRRVLGFAKDSAARRIDNRAIDERINLKIAAAGRVPHGWDLQELRIVRRRNVELAAAG